jgi:glycosyltransferase involved in cell wall biosynthesis
VNRLGVIQPHLTNTSREMFLELAGYCPIDLVVSPPPPGMGFQVAPIKEGPRVRYFCGPTSRPFGKQFGWIQWGVLRYLWGERPDAVFVNANPRYLTFWITLLWAKALGIPAHVHGHGFYRRGRISVPYKWMMTALLKLATTYICYAPIVRQAFLDNGFPERKLAVAHNSLINRFPVRPEEKTGGEPGVLFIGRLRRESGLHLLVRTMARLRREDGLGLRLHVVGEGEEEAARRGENREHPWITFHGGIYDPQQIREISLACFAGCYPGKAGLSVLHMMSLSLPVITHNSLRQHGPEPSFIREGVSGLLYDFANPEESLYRSLRSLATDPAKVAAMRKSAFDDYQSLAHPSLAERIWAVVGGADAAGRNGADCGAVSRAEDAPAVAEARRSVPARRALARKL